LSRNNINRTGAKPDANPPPVEAEPKFNPLHFVAPTEFVELPSRGLGYDESHPLFQKDTIEIRYMTAKDEDILSSRTLLKKGVAIERFLDNVIIDKNIKASELLVGDRNAIIIAARISGYGADYQTSTQCPACGANQPTTFDLNDQTIEESTLSDELGLRTTDTGNFITTMPFSKFEIEFRCMKGSDEIYLAKLATNKSKTNMAESALTDQYKRIIVSIQGHRDQEIINKYVNAMPTLDSRHLRACYKLATPDVKITEQFVCTSCNFEQELEVPFGADFFWPDR